MKPNRTIGSKAAFVAFASLAVGVLAPPAAAGGPPSGFEGRWRAIDCATTDQGELRCEIEGDGSVQWMTIGPGTTPAATFTDTYSDFCAANGIPNTRWVAAGSGEYDDIFLWLTFTKSGCGSFWQGGYGGIQLYHDAGSDTIWQGTHDEYGLMWHRVP